MNIITIAIKMDMSYEFYIKHKMHAIEWKLNSLINKSKALINKFNHKLSFSLHINGDNERCAVFSERT